MLAPPIRGTKEGLLCPALMWFVHFRCVFTYVFTIVEVRTTSATSHVRVIYSNYFSCAMTSVSNVRLKLYNFSISGCSVGTISTSSEMTQCRLILLFTTNHQALFIYKRTKVAGLFPVLPLKNVLPHV